MGEDGSKKETRTKARQFRRLRLHVAISRDHEVECCNATGGGKHWLEGTTTAHFLVSFLPSPSHQLRHPRHP